MNDGLDKKSARFAALVLAADRTAQDPITQHTGAACKAFAPVGGIPMVIRVLDTLAACDLISTIILCGPPEALHIHCPELKQRIASGQVIWLPNLDSPSRSAESGLSHVPSDTPVLLTTADHALLTPNIVQSFLRDSLTTPCDATVGMISQQTIATAFPGSKRTVIRLRDGGFCGCNLFTFNPQGRALVGFWRQAEDLRKRPWRLIGQVLGFRMILSYLFGRLTLQRALAAVSEKSGVKIQAIKLNDPRAGVDVDKVEDLVLAESIINGKPQAFHHDNPSVE
ncbi:MAG: nucleotidyltransferase family protein [Nitrosomonas sp.]|nr:nucleotidyltransferase family protein [Nitrosomonas sp.]MBP6075409.1 nucleotidyltransferase family protein [Nitrosomonas sp.]